MLWFWKTIYWKFIENADMDFNNKKHQKKQNCGTADVSLPKAYITWDDWDEYLDTPNHVVRTIHMGNSLPSYISLHEWFIKTCTEVFDIQPESSLFLKYVCKILMLQQDAQFYKAHVRVKTSWACSWTFHEVQMSTSWESHEHAHEGIYFQFCNNFELALFEDLWLRKASIKRNNKFSLFIEHCLTPPPPSELGLLLGIWPNLCLFKNFLGFK